MSGHQIFDHQGCHSGRCIFQQSVMARITLPEISDVKNHEWEKRRDTELLQEATRLMEGCQRLGCQVPPLQENVATRKPLPVKLHDPVKALMHGEPFVFEGELVEIAESGAADWFVMIKQGGGSVGGIVEKIEKVDK